MDEGTSKAIPLRRTRGARAVAAKANVAATATAWTAAVSDGLRRYAVEPTRQLWLAGLGGTTLGLRGAREAWALLVSEGTATELWLRRAIQRDDTSTSASA